MSTRLVVTAAVAILGFSGVSYAQPNHAHPEIIQQYDLKDGGILYVFKGGKMGMEDKKGKPIPMKNAHPMETQDGQRIMMYGNELWAVKAHIRASEGDADESDENPERRHTRK